MYQAPESFADLHFPAAGLDRSQAFWKQPNRDLGDGTYARTTPVGVNVRGVEPLTMRRRGGSRNGLAKYLPVPPVAGWLIQELAVVVRDSASAQA